MRAHNLVELGQMIGKPIILAEPDNMSEEFQFLLKDIDYAKNGILVQPLDDKVEPYWITYGLYCLAFY